MVHLTRDIAETKPAVVFTDEPKPASHQPSIGIQITHPDPDREAYLMSLVDETWPDIEETIHFLRDN